jgi:hypothetical protein
MDNCHVDHRQKHGGQRHEMAAAATAAVGLRAATAPGLRAATTRIAPAPAPAVIARGNFRPKEVKQLKQSKPEAAEEEEEERKERARAPNRKHVVLAHVTRPNLWGIKETTGPVVLSVLSLHSYPQE